MSVKVEGSGLSYIQSARWTTLSRLLQRMMVVNLCSNLFEKLKLAEISGLASGTASGGGGAGRGCQRRLGFDGYSELTIRLDWWQMFRMKVARKQWVMYHQRRRNLCRRSVNVFC